MHAAVGFCADMAASWTGATAVCSEQLVRAWHDNRVDEPFMSTSALACTQARHVTVIAVNRFSTFDATLNGIEHELSDHNMHCSTLG